jgi:hypothetical protein
MAAAEARTRRAALALHALAEGDREQVLAMLDDTQRRRLQPALHELRELGIPAGVWPGAEEPTLPPQALAASERIAQLVPQEAAARLAVLSPSTAAALLQAQDWPWAEAALAALNGPQRLAIRSQREAMGQPAPRFADALCRAFDAVTSGADQAVAAVEVAPSRRRWWPWTR